MYIESFDTVVKIWYYINVKTAKSESRRNVMAIITEEVLREELEKAKDDGRRAVLIYHNEAIWGTHHEEMVPGAHNYNFFLNQVKNGEDGVMEFDTKEGGKAIILAVLVDKMLSDDEYFKEVLDTCLIHGVEGPIEEFIEQ